MTNYLPIVTTNPVNKDILHSIYSFFKDTIFIKSGASSYVTGALLAQYTDPQLTIMMGFPEPGDVESLPTLAIEEIDIEVVSDETFGNKTSELVHPCIVHGFSGGESHDHLDKRQRTDLMSDTKQLLEDSEYMYYHTYPNFNTGADLAIRNVRGSFLPVIGNVESERHRFQVTFDLAYIRNE